MLKIPPHPDYPVESGCCLRGNDFFPAAVAIILKTDENKAQSKKSDYDEGSGKWLNEK